MVVYASFEDFIYIILGIAWVIYSAYNAKKKKNAKKNPASADKSKSFLDSIINELGIPTEQPEPVKSKLEQNDEYQFGDTESKIISDTEPQELFSYDDEYGKSNYIPPFDVTETETVVTSDDADTTIVEIEEEFKKNVHTIEKKKIKRIDLRKAVIYSAILKKVHF